MKRPDIWVNGKLMKWEDATVHVLCHSLQRGSTIFESLDCNQSVSGQPAIFRLSDHMKRFLNSAEIIRMPIPYTLDELNNGVVETVRASGMTDCIIRPLAFCPDVVMEVYPGDSPAIHVVVGLAESKKPPRSIRLKLSPFRKMDMRSMPIKSKVSANYITPMMAKADAIRSGFDDAILLDGDGNVAECPTGNIFIVKNRTPITTPSTKILAGITRNSAMTIACDSGFDVCEETFSSEELKAADEVFYVSSGLGIMPVRAVDETIFDDGKVGPVTNEIMGIYNDAARGKIEKYLNWLTFV